MFFPSSTHTHVNQGTRKQSDLYYTILPSHRKRDMSLSRGEDSPSSHSLSAVGPG